MSDWLTQLREALDQFGKTFMFTLVRPITDEPVRASEQASAIVAAARRWLALTETGQRVEWCEVHDAATPLGGGDNCVLAIHSMSFKLGDCRIVPKLLADYLTEEETK